MILFKAVHLIEEGWVLLVCEGFSLLAYSIFHYWIIFLFLLGKLPVLPANINPFIIFNEIALSFLNFAIVPRGAVNEALDSHIDDNSSSTGPDRLTLIPGTCETRQLETHAQQSPLEGDFSLSLSWSLSGEPPCPLAKTFRKEQKKKYCITWIRNNLSVILNSYKGWCHKTK